MLSHGQQVRILICLCVPEHIAADILEGCGAAHGHGGLELTDDFVHVDPEALFARTVDGGEDGTSDQNRVRAESDCTENINAGADAAVNDNGGLALYGLDDGGQNLCGGGAGALNASAMVGNDDAVVP